MIIPDGFGPLTVVSLVFAVLLVAGAACDVVLWALIGNKGPDRHGGVRRVAILLLTLIGLLSVIGSVGDEELKNMLRYVLGVLRGAALLVVWTLVIYDLVRYFDVKAPRRRGSRVH